MKMPTIQIDKCRRCYICVRTCSISALSIVNLQPYVRPEKCTGCGKCADACPFDLISMGDDESTAEEGAK